MLRESRARCASFAVMHYIPLLTLVLFASSCNLARMHGRACDKRLVRNDYVATPVVVKDSVHFAWQRDTGKEKLLLLHGYSGTGSLQWSKTSKLLGERYDCIMPDLLSHGQSAKWDTTRKGQSLDDQVAHVILILDSLGIDKPIAVVGNSYGGGVAARLAELHPQRIKKLVLYDALVSDYSAAMADSIARSVGNSGMLAIMGTPTPKDLRHAIRLSIYRNPPLPGFLMKQIHAEYAAPYRASQITLIKDLMAHEDAYLHKRFTWPMPVYVIWGEWDELIPNATGLAIVKRNELPMDHWSTIPRTGHVANLERPKAFVKELERVLAE
jgi:pimeloyl-ACP methyl ester carboxylesterase